MPLSIAKLTEDERIGLIGLSVMDPPRMNAFLVEDNAKADRYIKKLQAMFPKIRIIDRAPIGGLISVRVAGPLQG